MSTALEVLKGAREIVAKGWCRAYYAVDKDGKPVSETSPDACKHCSMGAMYASAGGYHSTEGRALVEEAALRLYSVVSQRRPYHWRSAVTLWNDQKARNQTEVVAAFDKAIEVTEYLTKQEMKVAA